MRRKNERQRRDRELAKDAFIAAAECLTMAHYEPGQAMLLGAIGIFRLSRSDPEHRFLTEAEDILKEELDRRHRV